MLTPKKTTLICSRCKTPIGGAKTVINEQWLCGDCTYLHDHPHIQPEPAVKRRSRAKPQEETLFVPPAARKQ